jgi:hypothetical protein
MNARGAFAILTATGALLAVPAAAKEGMVAKLDAPVRLGKAPGETLRVKWHIVHAQASTASASSIYLRVSRCGHRPLRVPAKLRSGGFTVRLKVPAGGIRKLMVGLKGWRITPGHKERADKFFQFDPPLYRSC